MEFVILSVCFQCKQGEYEAMIICFILGIGSLVSWNSMLTIADYYYTVFPVSNSRCFQFLIGLDITVQYPFFPTLDVSPIKDGKWKFSNCD